MASPEFSPERAIDTDKRTRWAAQGSNNWIKFRLNNSATIKKMCIHWYKGHRRKYIFDIEISTDGKNWKKISSQTSKVKEGKEVYEIEPTKASWVRLLCKGNNGNDWSSINEIEIHGKPETN
jgi:beta-galactosidase